MYMYIHLAGYVGCNHNNFKSKMQQSDFLGMVTFRGGHYYIFLCYYGKNIYIFIILASCEHNYAYCNFGV